jgi:hypothetical protein
MNKEQLIVFAKKAGRLIVDHAKAGAPLLIGFAVATVCAHAGPVANALTSAGTDTQTGITTAGVGMIGWQGMRIYMDEHHSINPGRVAGALTGSLFAFAPTSISTWAAGW